MEIALKLAPDDADIDAVRRPLRAFNRGASDRELNYQPFAFHFIDPSTAEVVGGATGHCAFDWVFVELLFVPEALRGTGLGRQLMARIEDFARDRNCVGIWLDTFSFQARPFYEKLGFTVFGTLEGQPVGGRHYFLSKRLDGATS